MAVIRVLQRAVLISDSCLRRSCTPPPAAVDRAGLVASLPCNACGRRLAASCPHAGSKASAQPSAALGCGLPTQRADTASGGSLAVRLLCWQRERERT